MYTQCPKCSTIFRVREEQIARHKGLVRCGTCRETFNGAWNVVNNLEAVHARTAVPATAGQRAAATPPPTSAQPRPAKKGSRLWKPLPPLTPPAPVAQAEAPSEPPEAEPIFARTAPPPLVFPEAEVDIVPVLPPVAPVPVAETPLPSAYEQLRLPDTEIPPEESLPPTTTVTEEESDTVEEIVLESHDNIWDKADQHPAPGLAPSHAPFRNASNAGARAVAEAPARRQRALAWTPATLVLLAIAIWQIGYFYFDTLAQSPSARPILEAVCAIFRCHVPERRQLSKIDVAGASVAYHEEIPGALKIAVNLVNRAPFPQAEPTLQVTLTDKDAKVVGRRAYKAAEYRRERSVLAPNVVTLTTLELAAPPENAVGYEIALFD